jgi:hypothetical protein
MSATTESKFSSLRAVKGLFRARSSTIVLGPSDFPPVSVTMKLPLLGAVALTVTATLSSPKPPSSNPAAIFAADRLNTPLQSKQKSWEYQITAIKVCSMTPVEIIHTIACNAQCSQLGNQKP